MNRVVRPKWKPINDKGFRGFDIVVGEHADRDGLPEFAAGKFRDTEPRAIVGECFGRAVQYLVRDEDRKPTPTGMIQKSTEIVELKGDLNGRVLYHVTSTFDFVAGTLVNTGDQVYSGTIAGSEPVMIHDDQFRFQVNLATGEESGKVYLFGHIAGPKVRCTLDVTGTGMNAEGNPTFTYTGQCTFRGQ